MIHSIGATERFVAHFQGEVVRLGRWRRGITQQELAGATGLAQSTVSRLESGKDQDPPCSALLSLATALNLWHVAFLPWGVIKPPSPHLATVHAVLSGCLANHFLHHQGNMLRCLHYCLEDAMNLRPDVCGLSVKLLGSEPAAVYGAMANRRLEIVTHEAVATLADDHETCIRHWRRGLPYPRNAEGATAATASGGFHEPVFLIDHPVSWGMVSWEFCAVRQTESREQTLHWIGAASRTVEQGVSTYLGGRSQGAELPDLAARVTRLEQLVSGQLAGGEHVAAETA